MKKRAFFLIFALSMACVLNAQDVILKTNGDEIQAKIEEVGTGEVKYKKADGSGPVYTILKSDVFMITYENGAKDVFGRKQTPVAATTAVPAAAPTSVPQAEVASDLPPASKAYKIGDIYKENGVTGIVVKISDDGRHGLIMSLDLSTDRWLKDKDAKFETGALFEDDGAKNMVAIEQYINTNSKSWDDFPLFAWARNLGAGWYIPAKDELVSVGEAINGGKGDSQTYSESTIKAFSKKIKSGKGKSLLADGFGQTGGFRQMFSSTEAEGGMMYSLMLMENAGSALTGALIGKTAKKGKLNIQLWNKTMFTGGGFVAMVGSRAVHKF